jgi:hypothetical protein
MTKTVHSIKEISEILSPVFAKYDIISAYLFGSYARGKATSKSDIDIYIPTLPSKMGLYIFGMYEDIKESLSKPIDIITDNEVFPTVESKKAFFDSINKDKVIIYEKGR